MKQLLLVIIFMSYGNNQYGQILNGEFDNWVFIESGGQPYNDLVNWQTNNTNSTTTSGATTPILQIIENNDNGISIITDFQGIDGISSGKISQAISTEELIKITYLSKCDSIYEEGACVVNIYTANNNRIFTDSVKQKEANYSIKTIEISELYLENSDTITIEFVGAGQLGEWADPQAYSEFNLLNVNTDYILNTPKVLETNSFTIYPNPFSDIIQIKSKETSFTNFKLYNSNGKLIDKGVDRNINTSNLISGLYILVISVEDRIQIERIVKY